MNPGIYIMAGGGFHVCGRATLIAKGVMIYNTVDSAILDPGSNTKAAELGQVKFNTNGEVFMSGVREAPYKGMTIYQGPDPNPAPAAYDPITNPYKQLSTAKCDGRNVNLTDIALIHMGTNGLGNPSVPDSGISGTIYAPGEYALFRDTVSGTNTLAVLTGCIFIDGAEQHVQLRQRGRWPAGRLQHRVGRIAAQTSRKSRPGTSRTWRRAWGPTTLRCWKRKRNRAGACSGNDSTAHQTDHKAERPGNGPGRGCAAAFLLHLPARDRRLAALRREALDAERCRCVRARCGEGAERSVPRATRLCKCAGVQAKAQEYSSREWRANWHLSPCANASEDRLLPAE